MSEHFDDKHHSDFLGIKTGDRQSISIVLENMGYLLKDPEAGYMNWLNEKCDEKDVLEKKWLQFNYWEKLVRFENTTKVGLITAFIVLLAVVFGWEWINHTWWLMLVLAGVSLRNLHKQRIELDEEKPFEAKIANVSFFITLFALIMRDLIITNRLDNSIEQLSQLFK